MKHIYLIFIGTIAMAINADAQRNIDLKVDVLHPTTNTLQTDGGSFNVYATVTNLGPDTLLATDSVKFHLTLDGQVMTIVWGPPNGVRDFGTYFYFTNKRLGLNDSLHIRFDNFAPYGGPVSQDMNRTVCFAAYPHHRGTSVNDTITDIPANNNTECVSYLWKANFSTNIAGTAAGQANIVGIYPNPATDRANMAISLDAAAKVMVRISNVTGRIMMREDKGYMTKGTHTISLNTGNLKNGLYLYHVQTGDEISTGKLMIAR